MSSLKNWSVDELLVEALKKPDQDRPAFLDTMCRDDQPLRDRIEGLLAAHEKAADFLEQPAVGVERHDFERPTEGPGTVIDRYKILQVIGEGGFGVVYMAEQKKPVKRKVALKIIKLGMDTKQVIARFESERQALAMMDHPNIAKVLDAGETESGRPYFVMELVRGVPITQYCDTENLNTVDRLKLFMDVCHAVQHAHQKGIIHRDLKPTNVMVTIADGRAIPKVIDFGIAKATNRELTDKTMFTEYHQLIGTPEYMSPEQAEMSGVDIDTRSDIFSLGVMLYELLTGTTPFDSRKLRASGLAEIQRIIREEEPHKPSTRVSSLAHASEARKGESASDRSSIQFIATHRATDPAQLRRYLKGDLDWIIMKCLEKDRARRYETANGLARDVARHLNHEPVNAGPPGVAYKFSKFVRRNRMAMTGAAVIAAMLVVSTVVSIGFAMSESEQRRVAEIERETAQVEAETSERVSVFLEDTLGDLDPYVLGSTLRNDMRMQAAEGRRRLGATEDEIEAVLASLDEALSGVNATDTALRLVDEQILSPAGEKIEQELTEEPRIAGRLEHALGNMYVKLGLYEQAERHMKRAVEIREGEFGSEHPDTLSSMINLANLYSRQGRYGEAEQLCVETLEALKRVLGMEHPKTLYAMYVLGWAYLYQGRYDEVELLSVKTLETQKRILGVEHPETLNSMNLLASLYWEQGRYEEAESLHLQTLEIRKRVLGEEHPRTLASMYNLSNVYESQGHYDKSGLLFLKLLEIGKRIHGEEHSHTLIFKYSVAYSYMMQGRYDEAESMFLEVLETRKRIFGPEYIRTLHTMHIVGYVYLLQGRYAEAEPLLLKTLEIRKRVLGEEHPLTLSAMNKLAILYEKQGRYGEAEPLYLQTLETRKRVLGEEHSHTLRTMNSLAILYEKQGRYEESESLLLRTLEIRKRILGEEHPKTLYTMTNLANLYRGQDRTDDAEQLVLQSLKTLKRTIGNDHPYTFYSMHVLAHVYHAQGRYDEAETLYFETLEISKRVLGEEHPNTLKTMNGLANLYMAQGRYEKAESLFLQILEAMKRVLGEEHPDTLKTMNNLKILFEKQGN